MGFLKTSAIFRILILLTLIYSVTPDQNSNPNTGSHGGNGNDHDRGDTEQQGGEPKNENRDTQPRRNQGGQHGGNGDKVDWKAKETKIYETCETTSNKKGQCFGSPDNCIKQKKGCNFMVLIEKDSTQKKYNFTLYTNEGKNEGHSYVAVGLSLEKEMKDTSIVACLSGRSDGQQDIIPFWSITKGPPQQVNLPSVKSTKRVKSDDEHIYCTFQHDTTFKTGNKEFKLDEKKYRILLAIGETTEESGNVKLLKHAANDYKISEPKYLSGAHDHSSSSRPYVSKTVLTTLSFLVLSIVRP